MISIIFFFVNNDILFLFLFFFQFCLWIVSNSSRCRQLFEIGIAYGRTEFWQYFDRLVTGQKSNLSNIETISEVSVSSFPNIELSWCSYHHDRFDSLKVMTFFIPPIFPPSFPPSIFKIILSTSSNLGSLRRTGDGKKKTRDFRSRWKYRRFHSFIDDTQALNNS